MPLGQPRSAMHLPRGPRGPAVQGRGGAPEPAAPWWPSAWALCLPAARGPRVPEARPRPVAPGFACSGAPQSQLRLRAPERRHRLGPAHHVCGALVLVVALVALPQGPWALADPGDVCRAPGLHDLHGLFQHLPCENRRLVRPLWQPQHRHWQPALVRLGLGAPRGAALLPLPDAHPRPGHNLPGLHGQDERRPCAWRVPQRALPLPRCRPLLPQPPEPLLPHCPVPEHGHHRARGCWW
mmetsp:Transcript_34595/g.109862  ORF Transcript_34595/g.109862 Transcript_34595/m.109862 type:complete len:239 (-) Transcript_34595:228-944(-)